MVEGSSKYFSYSSISSSLRLKGSLSEVVTGDPLLGVSVREKSDHWRMSLLKAKR